MIIFPIHYVALPGKKNRAKDFPFTISILVYMLRRGIGGYLKRNMRKRQQQKTIKYSVLHVEKSTAVLLKMLVGVVVGCCNWVK